MAVNPDLIINTLMANRPKYEKGFADQTTRRRFRLAMLRRRNRIMLNGSGTSCIRKVKYTEPTVQQYSNAQQIDFGNHNFLKEIQIPWASYVVTDSIPLLQEMLNTGSEKLVDEVSAKEKNLRDAMDRTFNAEFYKDGSASGRENAIYGFETFLSYSTCTAADRIARPNDTYGLTSLSTVLANYGGTWSSDLPSADRPNATLANDFPNGNGTADYDFNSPLFLNYASTAWNSSQSTSFVDNCWDVITQGILWQSARTGMDMGLVTLGQDLFFQYKQALKALRRIQLPHSEASQLGLGNRTANHDGTAIHWDFDCPSGVGYIESVDDTKLTAVGGKLFHMKGPDTDPRSMWSKLMAYLFYGAVDWNPRCVAKIGDFTS